MIPIIEGLVRIPFFADPIPTGFISMVFFVLIFNLLTLRMAKHYFTSFGLTAKAETVAFVFEESGLTQREAEMIPLLVKGYSNKEIATRLFITEGTVKNHLHNIYQKTGAKNRTELSHFLKK